MANEKLGQVRSVFAPRLHCISRSVN